MQDARPEGQKCVQNPAMSATTRLTSEPRLGGVTSPKHEVCIRQHPVGTVRRSGTDPTVLSNQGYQTICGGPHPGREIRIQVGGLRLKCRFANKFSHYTSPIGGRHAIRGTFRAATVQR
jgi:hypothetical protein